MTASAPGYWDHRHEWERWLLRKWRPKVTDARRRTAVHFFACALLDNEDWSTGEIKVTQQQLAWQTGFTLRWIEKLWGYAVDDERLFTVVRTEPSGRRQPDGRKAKEVKVLMRTPNLSSELKDGMYSARSVNSDAHPEPKFGENPGDVAEDSSSQSSSSSSAVGKTVAARSYANDLASSADDHSRLPLKNHRRDDLDTDYERCGESVKMRGTYKTIRCPACIDSRPWDCANPRKREKIRALRDKREACDSSES